MDYSGFRPSGNIEDQRGDPWGPLYRLYALGGMEATPTDVFGRMIESLRHPFTKTPPMMTPYNADMLTRYSPNATAATDLNTQAGINSNYWNNPPRYDFPLVMADMLRQIDPQPQQQPSTGGILGALLGR